MSSVVLQNLRSYVQTFIGTTGFANVVQPLHFYVHIFWCLRHDMTFPQKYNAGDFQDNQ
jgi:hypothetical protein